MENIYKNLYSAKKHLNLKENERLKIMQTMINLKAGNSLLDIGCYDGTFLTFFKSSQAKLYGIEANKFALEKCRKRGFKVKDFYFDGHLKMPFKNNFFDYIIAGEIIEHIFDTNYFLEEIRRLLKKKGFLTLSTPNLASLGRRLMLLAGLNPFIELSYHELGSSGHIRYFTKKTLFGLLKKHKFKIVDFKSDVVNFDRRGFYSSKLLAKLLPTWGRSLIVKCQKP